MSSLISLVSPTDLPNEPAVEVYAATRLKEAGYEITLRSCKSKLLKKHWPSKSKEEKAPGFPDILVHLSGMDKPVCVWENKGPEETAAEALAEAQFYIEGLRKALPNEPALPRIAAGFNGVELKASAYTNDSKWVAIKVNGVEIGKEFPNADFLSGGIASNGTFTAVNGSATASDLRALLARLRTLYRNIPSLASGRTPIDFTVALLTLKLVIEQSPDWGTWSEMPRFAPGAKSEDHAVGERLETFAKRVLDDHSLRQKYGDIFQFHEKSDTFEVAFSFSEVLATIPKGCGHFVRLYGLFDQTPPLTSADFDIFGEVYQAIGDEATKKKLGEFFTGRHIIGGVLPVFFARSGFDKSFDAVGTKKIADVACGTGGFLTETLRLVRRLHTPTDVELKHFARGSFHGYDLGHANASRARVNMYFAGDGFSTIVGGVDTLSESNTKIFPKPGFDVVMTNPPYGASNYGRIEEAFLQRCLDLLVPGTGWLLIVLPTGVLENPRAGKARFALINRAVVTDVVSLPKHAFAPYTQQRTAVIVAQKRPKPLVSNGDGWAKLIDRAGHERISMFIVDNDGFANSDKRYPTNKRDPSGEWLHNDLSDWIDGDGVLQPSKLYRAAVHRKPPAHSVDEFGDHLGAKYGVFEVAELAHAERGAVLLPDIPLRAELKTIPYSDWKTRVKAVEAFASGAAVQLPLPFAQEVAFLMDHGIEFPASSLTPYPDTIGAMFNLAKGNPGLTEAMIYQSLTPDGLPVYGGGSGIPRFRAAKTLCCSSGEKATVFCGPALVVSMDGSSGSIQVVPDGEFFCNHHGMVLTPKGELNLWCVAQIAEPALRRLASNKSGSATLTKPALETLAVQVPAGTLANEIEGCRRTLTKLSRLV